MYANTLASNRPGCSAAKKNVSSPKSCERADKAWAYSRYRVSASMTARCFNSSDLAARRRLYAIAVRTRIFLEQGVMYRGYATAAKFEGSR